MLVGDGGGDALEGGTGDDTLFGGEGDNLARGGDGTDWITGSTGEDTPAGVAADWFEGGTGHDLFELPADRVAGLAPTTLADFNAAGDRLELVLPEAGIGAAQVTLDLQPDGSGLVRLNGAAVAHVLNAAGLEPAQIGLRVA